MNEKRGQGLGNAQISGIQTLVRFQEVGAHQLSFFSSQGNKLGVNANQHGI
jgi:hypothetical protein